jgi:RHS repeat-associated protein
LTFGYDPWGNLLQSSTTGSAGCAEPLPLNVTVTTANRISGYCYDTAGNLLDQTTCPANPPHAYAYNAENQLTSAGGVTYTYDGDGRRIQKSNGKLYWYGMSSDPLDETDLAGNTNNSSFNEYIFFGGKRIARRDSTNAVNYYFSDHLGTARVSTNSSGSICYDADFYPFGGERIVTNTCDSAYKFTGQERDAESGLDNFGARFDATSMGRFMSPDWSDSPEPVPYADLTNPQSFNLYTYGQNNPINSVDDGHGPCDAGDSFVNAFGNVTPGIDCAEQRDPKPPAKCGFWCQLGKFFGSSNQKGGASAITIPFPLVGRLAPVSPVVLPATAVVAGAAALSIGIANAQIENAQGLEQLAAIESIVAAENARLLASRIKETVDYLTIEQANFLAHVKWTSSSTNQDPNNRDRWTRDLLRKLQNMRRVLKRLPESSRVQWEKAIQALQDMLPK